MPMHRRAQVPGERGAGGTGEKTRWAGESCHRPERAAQAGDSGMDSLQPENTGETGGDQKTRLLQMAQKPLQRPSLSGRPIP